MSTLLPGATWHVPHAVCYMPCAQWAANQPDHNSQVNGDMMSLYAYPPRESIFRQAAGVVKDEGTGDNLGLLYPRTPSGGRHALRGVQGYSETEKLLVQIYVGQ